MSDMSPPPFNAGGSVPPSGSPRNGKSVASLVLGIVGIVFSMCCYIGIIPGAVGLVLGLMARKEEVASQGKMSGMTTAGVIVSAVAVAITALIFLLAAVFGVIAIFTPSST